VEARKPSVKDSGSRCNSLVQGPWAYPNSKMAKGGNIGDKERGDKGKGLERIPSSSRSCAFTREKIEAWETQNRFLENGFEEAQWEVNQVEEMVKLKKKQTSR
jgi:hypothetical protein